jgi:hypothetical protein
MILDGDTSLGKDLVRKDQWKATLYPQMVIVQYNYELIKNHNHIKTQILVPFRNLLCATRN